MSAQPQTEDRMIKLTKYFEEDIKNVLERYKHAVDARVCAEIDAGACQTRRDHEHKDKMQDAEYTAEEVAVKELIRMMTTATILF